MDESEKMTKNGFPPRRTSKKQQKYHFRRGWKVKNGKNSVSAAAESYKTAKNAFPPRLKSKKWKKQCFRHGGRTKNGKSKVSAMAETLKYDISKRKAHLEGWKRRIAWKKKCLDISFWNIPFRYIVLICLLRNAFKKSLSQAVFWQRACACFLLSFDIYRKAMLIPHSIRG